MPLDIKFKPDLLEAAIAQLGDRAIKGMSDKMRKIAVRIRDLARDNAPHKTGLLEEEIHYGTKPGKNRRNTFVIWIDLDAARKNGKKGELGDYAFIMEEQLRPHGRGAGKPLQLGPGSRDKARTGKKVGGRFLARAFIDATKNIENELAAEVRRVLGAQRLADVGYVRDTEGDTE